MPADHLLPLVLDGAQKSAGEITSIVTDPRLTQTSIHAAGSTSSTNGILVQQVPSRPTRGTSDVGGSPPNTEQQPGVPSDATDGLGPSATSFPSASNLAAHPNLAAPQPVVAPTADSLETSFKKGYVGPDFTSGKARVILYPSTSFASIAASTT